MNFTRSLRERISDESGAALVVSLMLLLGLAAMAMAAVAVSSSDYVVAGNHRQRTTALHAAEAGLNEAMHRLSQAQGTMANVGGQQVDIAIYDPATPPDPNWRAQIFLRAPNTAPVIAGSSFTTGTIQNPAEYLEYSDPNDPAEALLIQHKLRDFDGDGVTEVAYYDPSRVPPENPVTGFPIERISVRGRFGQALRMIQADVVRFPLNPNVNAALSSNGTVDVRGNVTVCGNNHRMIVPHGTNLPACSPAWDAPNGNLVAVTTTGGPVETRGSTDLLGSPGPTNIDPASTFMTLSQTLGISDLELRSVLDNADRNTLDGSGPWDGITYIRGDYKVTNGTGEGLLYVEGTLEISGNLEWTGLIYVGDQIRCTGSMSVIGAVMAASTNVVTGVDFGAGTPTILYSREALVRTLSLAMDYIILSWKEI